MSIIREARMISKSNEKADNLYFAAQIISKKGCFEKNTYSTTKPQFAHAYTQSNI